MSMGKPTAVIYDKDSTLFDTQQRWHLSPERDRTSSWDKYAQACADDVPMPGTVRRMQLDHPYHQVHICTGASVLSMDATVRLLDLHVGPAWDYLEMRPEGNEDTNVDLKVRYVRKLRDSGIEVVLFYEDWGPAARAIYEQTGVPVLGINPFYPEDKVAEQQAVGSDGKGGGM